MAVTQEKLTLDLLLDNAKHHNNCLVAQAAIKSH